MIERNFFNELKNASFKPITYGIYNKLDDDGITNFVNYYYKDIFSIDDYEYYDFELTDKEKFLVKMHNTEYKKNIKKLEKDIEPFIGTKVYIYYDSGIVRLVKLKLVEF